MGSNGSVWLVDTTDGELLQTLEGRTEDTLTVAFSPDGALLVSSTKDGTVILWNARTGQLVHTLDTPVARFVVFSPDGMMLLLGCEDGTVRLWGVPPH